MPRIHPRTLWQAHLINRLLPRLLPTCRDIRSAQLELCWLREHAFKNRSNLKEASRRLERYVWRRSRGEPLQYILGTEYFGDLEIKCRPGVLIPRQETAASVSYLVDLLSHNTAKLRRLRVLDLCTGTGCIPLLFHHQYYSYRQNGETCLEMVGVDISRQAVQLAQVNHDNQLKAQHNIADVGRVRLDSLKTVRFMQGDALREPHETTQSTPSVIEALQHSSDDDKLKYDILISNPPYVSFGDYFRTTSPSVRKYEPKLALVPPKSGEQQARSFHDGDLFYPRLLETAEQICAKIVLFEVADLAQAKRVASMALDRKTWSGIEIWRDNPSDDSEPTGTTPMLDREVRILGSGHGRSVLLYRSDGAIWLGK